MAFSPEMTLGILLLSEAAGGAVTPAGIRLSGAASAVSIAAAEASGAQSGWSNVKVSNAQSFRLVAGKREVATLVTGEATLSPTSRAASPAWCRATASRWSPPSAKATMKPPAAADRSRRVYCRRASRSASVWCSRRTRRTPDRANRSRLRGTLQPTGSRSMPPSRKRLRSPGRSRSPICSAPSDSAPSAIQSIDRQGSA